MPPRMMERPIRSALSRALALVLCTAPCASPASAPADLVVTGAKVLTVDAGFRVAEAVAIRDGVFVLVGTSAEARALVGPRTRVIDAGGKTVIPGLIDSHVHALGVAEAETRGAFRDLRTIAEIQAWLREKTAAVPEGQWVFSPRVFPTRLAERRLPTRAELDAAAPRHPVVVDAAYALVVNTPALQAAGIGPDTPSPRGGAIVKDEQGRPTGLLRNVGGLLDRFQGPRRPERLLPALEDVHRRYNEAGITSVIERAADLAGYRAYAQLRAQGRPRVRATVTLRVDSDGTVEGTEAFLRSLPLRPGEGDDLLRVGPLKIFADGGILAGTAFMREPYGPAAASLYGVADPSYRGFLTIAADKIRNIVRTGHRMGWQMCAHVTGDAGVDTVLDAFAAADADRPIRDRRFTLIHAYFPTPEVARRAAALGVAVDTQPAWYYKDADALLTGPRRAAPAAIPRDRGMAARGREGRPQHGPHVRRRSRRLPQSLQSVPHHVRGGDATDGGRTGDRSGAGHLTRGRAAHDDGQRGLAQLRGSPQGLDRGRQAGRPRGAVRRLPRLPARADPEDPRGRHRAGRDRGPRGGRPPIAVVPSLLMRAPS